MFIPLCNGTMMTDDQLTAITITTPPVAAFSAAFAVEDKLIQIFKREGLLK
jgi:hypothetical protein